MKRLAHSVLRGAAFAVGALLTTVGGLAVAATIALTTGPQPAADLQSIINTLTASINATLAPLGSGAMNTALTVNTSSGANTLSIQGAPALSSPQISASGIDGGIDISISPPTTGVVLFGGTGSWTGTKGASNLTLGTLGPNVTLTSATVRGFLTFKASDGSKIQIPYWQ